MTRSRVERSLQCRSSSTRTTGAARRSRGGRRRSPAASARRWRPGRAPAARGPLRRRERGHLDHPGRGALDQQVDHRLASRRAAEALERLEHRHVRLGGAVLLDALTAPHEQGPRGLGGGDRGRHEGRLAGAGLAGHHDDRRRRPRRPARAGHPRAASSSSRPTIGIVPPAGAAAAAGAPREPAPAGEARGERRVLAQDAPLQVAQRSRRLMPSSSDKRLARLLVGGERLRLAPGAVQREHLLLPQAARAADGARRAPRSRGTTSACRPRARSASIRSSSATEPQLLEPPRLDGGERLGELLQRGAAPQRQGALEDLGRRGRDRRHRAPPAPRRAGSRPGTRRPPRAPRPAGSRARASRARRRAAPCAAGRRGSGPS